jgi:hypothetical protein
MAQIRGTAGYNLGGQNTFGAPSGGDSMNDPSPLDAIRAQTSKIEDFLDTLSDPVKPYVFKDLSRPRVGARRQHPFLTTPACVCTIYS